MFGSILSQLSAHSSHTINISQGCCASTASPRTSPYPPQNPQSSSSRAITAPASSSGIHRPSTNHSSRHTYNSALGSHPNQPIRIPSWTSKRRWTRAALDKEREEFFDTRTSGQQESWQTLRVAVEAIWNASNLEDGVATAQAMLDASSMTAPVGDLSKNVFDSRGELYSIPVWVISDPDNLDTNIETENDSGRKILRKSNSASTVELSDGEAERRREEKGKSVEVARIKLTARLSESITGNTDVGVLIGQNDSTRLCSRKILDASGVSDLRFASLI